MEVLSEWKDIANAVTKIAGAKKPIPVNTIRRWHYNYMGMPFLKSYPSETGRVVIDAELLAEWYQSLTRFYPSLRR